MADLRNTVRGFILETERTYLRKMTFDDRYELCGILQDADVMYAYEHAFSDSEVDEWLSRQLERYEKDGFGLYAVIDKRSSELLGQCGLTIQDTGCGSCGVEVGYLFKKRFWHMGYATETARACRDYAFNVLGKKRVYSIIRDTNTASQRVAERNGMTRTGDTIKHYYGMDMLHYVYSVDNVY